MRKEGVRDLYSPPNAIRVTKWGMRCVGLVTAIGERRFVQDLEGNLNESHTWKIQALMGIILKWVLQ
jgi:hypothetical protein